ncbi:MAG: hypothetical protein M3Q40_04575 [Pseudomonadota bacterium]|nr:hypothetical protein [Pseudomonadota bacterium]
MQTRARNLFRHCAGECFWACVWSAAALAVLCGFVFTVEAGGDIQRLRGMITAPINLTRFVALAALLTLLGYILRAAAQPGAPLVLPDPATGDQLPEQVLEAAAYRDGCEGAAHAP